jgi:hypothetical protein
MKQGPSNMFRVFDNQSVRIANRIACSAKDRIDQKNQENSEVSAQHDAGES